MILLHTFVIVLFVVFTLLNIVLSICGKIRSLRGIIFRGKGNTFCAGADLSEFGSAPSQIIAREVRWQRDLWGLFLKMQKPIIAQLHGFVIGSGIEIASFCDLRVATESAKFKMPESSLGLIPAAGGTAREIDST